MKLAGAAAIVTGAGRGIGRSVALALGREGAAVGLLARSAAELDTVAREVRAAGGRAHAVRCDVADAHEVARAVSACEQELGPVRVLVNNAGVVEAAPVVETTEESWDRVLDVNLKGAFLMCRAVLPGMLARGGGRIVNVASISATLGTPRLASYCASKWGLVGFTKALSEEVKGQGVIVAAVLPGSVDTDMLKKSAFPPDMAPADVAEIVRWLCCDAPPAVAGTALEAFA